MKHFLSVHDVIDINELISLSLFYKKNPLTDETIGKGKTMGLFFLNPSLRTRMSTQIAAENLGLRTIALNLDKDVWNIELENGAIMNGSSVEHIIEAAGVIGQYVDILGVRSFAQLKNKKDDYDETVMQKFKQYSNKPMVSLESATLHPLQSLADLVSIKECWNFNKKPKVVMTWAPHIKALPQAVPNSFAQWMQAWKQCDFIVTHPPGYELDENVCGNLNVEYDQEKAIANADFIYVKNWSSTKEYGQILNNDATWMITNKKISSSNQAKIMHCLPVRRNVVIADEVLDGPQSIVLQQAKNRICSAQAVLKQIISQL